MKNILATTAMAGFMAATLITPVDAGRRHHDGDGYRGHHHGHSYRGHRHGYWRDGKWIALGVLGAAAAAAIADDDDCYRTRRGRVVCR